MGGPLNGLRDGLAMVERLRRGTSSSRQADERHSSDSLPKNLYGRTAGRAIYQARFQNGGTATLNTIGQRAAVRCGILEGILQKARYTRKAFDSILPGN